MKFSILALAAVRANGWASYYATSCGASMSEGAMIMGYPARRDHGEPGASDAPAAAPSAVRVLSSDKPDRPRRVGWRLANGTEVPCGASFDGGARLVATLEALRDGSYAEHVFEVFGGARFVDAADAARGAAYAACDGRRAVGAWREPPPGGAPPPSVAVAAAPSDGTITVVVGYAKDYEGIWLTNECALTFSGREHDPSADACSSTTDAPPSAVPRRMSPRNS